MKRVLTSLILIPLVLFVVILGPPWLVFAATTLCAMLCYREYCGIAAEYGVTNLGPLGFAAGLGVLALPDGGSIFLDWVYLSVLRSPAAGGLTSQFADKKTLRPV